MDQKNKQEQLQEIFSFYKKQSGDQENYRAMLEELQEVYGFLSEEILKQAAEALHIKVTVLSCLVKYSSTLKLAPYQHKIVACTGERCGNKNGDVYKRQVPCLPTEAFSAAGISAGQMNF